MSTRNAFGAFLTEVAANHPELFALTADFTKSTGLAKFKEQYPNQFLSTGIAEQNMIALASGLASEGKNVFASSFASFVTTRCYEQVKVNLGYMQHNVKLVGIASGLGVSHQGNTHFGLDDVSLMRAIPNMTIVVPSDCTEVAKATITLADFEGPAYLRLVGEGFIGSGDVLEECGVVEADLVASLLEGDAKHLLALHGLGTIIGVNLDDVISALALVFQYLDSLGCKAGGNHTIADLTFQNAGGSSVASVGECHKITIARHAVGTTGAGIGTGNGRIVEAFNVVDEVDLLQGVAQG